MNVMSLDREPMTGVASQSRRSLAPIAPNVAPRTANVLKRRREDAPLPAGTEVISLLDSDDEEGLQDQVDALQAKIAAIRQRTAQEDAAVPKKKRKHVERWMKPPSSSTQRPALDSYLPPAQSQQVVKAPPPTTQAVNNVWPREGGVERAQTTSISSLWSLPTDPFIALSAPSQACSYPAPKPMPTPGFGQQDVWDRTYAWQTAPQPSYMTTYSDVNTNLAAFPPIPAEHPDVSQAWAQFPDQAPQQMWPMVPQPGHSTQGAAHQPATVQERPEPVRSADPTLCPEQQEIVDMILQGHNVFYTGSAGCGKSTVLKAFVPKLRERGLTVKIVAPTGKAALDINGTTTWTFAGWTPLSMKKPLEELLKAAHGKFVKKRLTETDVLVIDEISMVENQIFERLNLLMKQARGSQRPFGGVQLIVTGDFCQLPPVKPFQYCMHCGREQYGRSVEGSIVYKCPKHGESRDADKWAFRSKAWAECGFQHVNLTNIHRQNDEVFIKILQKLRVGNELHEADRQLLLDHPCDVNNAIKLFPTREQVREVNQREFDKLTTQKRSYTCLDLIDLNPNHPHFKFKEQRDPKDHSLVALKEHRLEALVEFKTGMLVVLLINLDIGAGLVNGSQGRIVGFEPYLASKLPKAKVAGDNNTGSTSFSRKAPTGRRGPMTSAEPVPVESELRGEYASLREEQIRLFIQQPRNVARMWPVVQFDHGLTRTIYADCQINELGDESERPYTLLGRTQIPLVAAWAMTVHKSQGMTLNRVIVDLGKSFEEGQDYVALSRARSLDGLQVLSLGRGFGNGGNPQVKEFLADKFNIR